MHTPPARPRLLTSLRTAVWAPRLLASVCAVALLMAGCGEDGGFDVGALGELELRPAAVEISTKQLARDATREVVVDVVNVGTGDVTISAVTLTPDDAPSAALPEVVTATLGALPRVLAPGEHAPLTIVYTHRDDEPRSLRLTLALAGARAASAVLPITILRSEARLVATPTTARFEAGSDLRTTTVTLLNTGTRTLWIDRMVLRGAGSFAATLGDFRVEDSLRDLPVVPPVAIEAGTSHALRVDFIRQSATPVTGELVLYGDAPNTLDGFVVPLLGNDTEPCVIARPALVTFGEKSPDTINDIPIEVENCGERAAAIAGLDLATDDDLADPTLGALGVDGASSERFSLVFADARPDAASPWLLASGEIRTFTVRYHAASAAEVPEGSRVEDRGFVLVRSNALAPVRAIEVTAATRGEVPPSECMLTPIATVPVDPLCSGMARPGSLEPRVLWGRTTFDVSPVFDNVMMTPVVGNLDDDNGDGRIDERDIADIVITRFPGGDYKNAGVLSALSGADGRQLWSVTRADAFAPFAIGGVALGDLDGNGRPEVCVHLLGDGLACFQVAAPGAASREPELRFRVEGCGPSRWPVLGLYPAIADLDADGAAEVLFHGCVYAQDGTLIARAPAANFASIMPFGAEIDGDPGLEIVDGGFVYDTPVRNPGGPVTLTLLHDFGLSEGRAAVGDFDHDGKAEIVVSDFNRYTLALFDPDGATDPDLDDGWSVPIPIVNLANGGGPPTIADLDGDGELEIGIASENEYLVFDTDGTVLWSQPCQDASSRQTGSAVFDFDGDGAAEVLYADEETLRVFDGATGTERFRIEEHGSGTGVEYPVIADVNRDGRAEIVLASNNYAFGQWNGVHVLGARDDTWGAAPPVWNQHAYHVGGILADLRVPRVPTGDLTSFRAAAWPDPTPRPYADLHLVGLDTCPTACDPVAQIDGARVRIQIGNGGLLAAAGSITLRDGSATGPIVTSSLLPEIPSGGVFVFEALVPRGIWAGRLLVAVVTTDGSAFDCDADNDVSTLGAWPWPDGPTCP